MRKACLIILLTTCSYALKAQAPYVYLSLYNLIVSDLNEADILASSLAGNDQFCSDYTVNQLGQILQPIVFNNLNNFVYTDYAYEFVDLVSDVCGSPCTETNTAMLLQVLSNFGCQDSDCS